VLRACAPALACALAVFSGCGSGSVSKADYVKKVNALCAAEDQEIRAAAIGVGPHAGLLAVLDAANAVRAQSLAKIEAVKTPSSGAISPEWLRLRRRALAISRKRSAGGLKRRIPLRESEEYANDGNRALKIALAYGLTKCSGLAST
jgi:hypothetical protein